MSVFQLATPPAQLSASAQRQALRQMVRQLAYREGEFKLSSGKTSCYYVNCKPVTLHPQGAYLVGQAIWQLLPADTGAIAGLTLGADPIVTAVSLMSLDHTQPERPTDLPAIIVRKEAKGHGTQAWLEGPSLPTPTKIWILEDVVTTGASALKAAERVTAAGHQVAGIAALIDRQEGGAELYASRDLEFRAVFRLSDITATDPAS